MRRYLSILLSLVLVFTMMPAAVFSDEYVEEPVTVEEPAPAPEPEPAPAPEPEPAPAPASEPEPAPAPASEPEPAPAAEEPEKEPAEEPAAEPVKEPAEEPAAEPAEEPAEDPAAEPAEEPAEEPAAEPAEEPKEEPAEQPAEEPVTEPAEEPAETPAEEVTEGFAIVLKDTDLYKDTTGDEKLAQIKKDAIVYVKVSEENRWAAFLWVGEEGLEAFIDREDAELVEAVETQAEKHVFQEIEVYDMTDFVVLPEIEEPAELLTEEQTEETSEESAEIVDDPMLLALDPNDPLVRFVERAYSIILGREGDPDGIAFWVNNLRTGVNTGAEMIKGFVVSPEFSNAGLSSEQKVNKMYNVMLGRDPDPLGEDWVVKLDAGVDILAIVNGFAISEEFGRVCAEYQINPGSIALDPAAAKYNAICEYVMRCYSVILGRRADGGGLKDWAHKLLSGAAGGANIVDEFVKSEEFQGQGNSNKKVVEILYKAMLGRSPDAAGLADWTAKLDNGESVRSIIQGFSVAGEFLNICRAYGIQPGTIVIHASEINQGVTDFVKRCYREGVGREADPGGLNDWCGKILNGTLTPAQVALGFVVAPECVNKYPTNTESFVEMLYKLYMGREADDAGKNDWMNNIRNNWSREEVANAFGNSREFKKIVASYNLDAGYGPGIPPEDEFDLNDVHYTVLGDGAVCVAKYNGTAASVVIEQFVKSPVQHNDYQVLTIGPSAFEDNKTLVSIDLPDSIITIGQKAFKNCSNLSNMN